MVKDEKDRLLKTGRNRVQPHNDRRTEKTSLDDKVVGHAEETPYLRKGLAIPGQTSSS